MTLLLGFGLVTVSACRCDPGEGSEVDAGGPDGGSSAADAGRQDGGVFEADAGGRLVPDLDGGVCFTVTPACLGRPNLLRNPGFESVPVTGGVGEQGVLPDEWVPLQVTPDTYTVDGGFGLLPEAFGNFVGIVPHGGARWVSAWSFADERGGQQLSATLTPGRTYRAEGWLQQAVRSDLDNPGAYSLHLASDREMSNLVFLGQWCPTASVDAGWVRRAFTFVAPDAGRWLVFKPEAGPAGSAAPGLDDMELTDVTGCAP